MGFVGGLYSSLKLNPNNNGNDDIHDLMAFGVWNDYKDFNITIYPYTNSEADQKVRTICNWILPTQGNTLYSLLDTQGIQSQTLELDGRTVTIHVAQRFLSITFSPIK